MREGRGFPLFGKRGQLDREVGMDSLGQLPNQSAADGDRQRLADYRSFPESRRADHRDSIKPKELPNFEERLLGGSIRTGQQRIALPVQSRYCNVSAISTARPGLRPNSLK